MGENRFEPLADIDVDCAVFQVGVQHYVFGPPDPTILIGTGALELKIRVHISDIDPMIEALTEAKAKIEKHLKAAAKKAKKPRKAKA